MIRLTVRTIFFASARSADSTMIRSEGLVFSSQAANSPTTVDFPLFRNAISRSRRS